MNPPIYPARAPAEPPCRPWWREPWPWLLMAGPAVAMAGCALTIVLAARYADQEIHTGVVKKGLVVNSEPGAGLGAAP